MRQVLIVVELRESKFELRKPVVDWIVSRRHRLIGALNEEIMKNLIVVARRAISHFGRQRDRVEQDRQGDQQQREPPRGHPSIGASDRRGLNRHDEAAASLVGLQAWMFIDWTREWTWHMDNDSHLRLKVTDLWRQPPQIAGYE